MNKKPIINLKVLPGEPLDGSGRICIHLFVPDEKGPFVEPNVTQVVDSKLTVKPTRGRLACDYKRLVKIVERNGIKYITVRTDDPIAVTCLKCIASNDYKRMMEEMTVAQNNKG